jgi:hypothetical protein
MGLGEFIAQQGGGLAVGGVIGGVIGALFRAWLKTRADRREEAKAEQERVRAERENREAQTCAERESHQAEVKAWQGAVHGHESNLRAQTEVADRMASELDALRRAHGNLVGEHSSLGEQHAKAQRELESSSDGKRRLADQNICLFLGAVQTLRHLKDLESRFQQERDALEERSQAEVFEMLRIDPTEFEARLKDEAFPPMPYYIAFKALQHIREALLLRAEHTAALTYNTYLPLILFALVDDDKGLTGKQLGAALRKEIADHQQQMYALLESPKAEDEDDSQPAY